MEDKTREYRDTLPSGKKGYQAWLEKEGKRTEDLKDPDPRKNDPERCWLEI